MLIDAATGERQLIWAELDANATSPDETDLLIHPARNLLDGHRYIVALRNLRDADGTAIAVADRVPSSTATTSRPTSRRSRTAAPTSSRSSTRSEGAGIERKSLYMAWDFTVASERNLSERMLSIRNDAYAQLGDTDLDDGIAQGNAPDYEITDVTDFPTADRPRGREHPRGHGHLHRPLLPRPARLPARLEVRPRRRTGCRSGSPATRCRRALPATSRARR